MKNYLKYSLPFALALAIGSFNSASAEPSQKEKKNSRTSNSEGRSMKVLTPATMPPIATPPEHFTGSVKIVLLSQGEKPSNLGSASVTFQPKARSAWHVHPRGQILVVTEGAGLIQEYGEPIRKIKPGDVVWTPPGVRHWHGASPDSAMTHIAIHESLNGSPVKWLEKVTDQEYRAK